MRRGAWGVAVLLAAAAAGPAAAQPVNDLLTNRSVLRESDREPERRTTDRGRPQEKGSSKFGERIGDTLHDAVDHCGGWFQSDHVFDGFISPVTNPFLFEDPRS